jgi:hypothetical protein
VNDDDETTLVKTVLNDELLLSLDLTKSSDEDEGVEEDGGVEFDDEAYFQQPVKPTAARWQDDEFDVPALDEVRIIWGFYDFFFKKIQGTNLK